MIDLLLMIIFTEAIVNLIFYAGPLQKIRSWLIEHSQFLVFNDDHLLECKYCTSFWVGLFSAILYVYLDYEFISFFILVIVLHRCSNYVHIIFSLIRDIQFNIRLNRGK
jgi:hypothetical protein